MIKDYILYNANLKHRLFTVSYLKGQFTLHRRTPTNYCYAGVRWFSVLPLSLRKNLSRVLHYQPTHVQWLHCTRGRNVGYHEKYMNGGNTGIFKKNSVCSSTHPHENRGQIVAKIATWALPREVGVLQHPMACSPRKNVRCGWVCGVKNK